MSTPVKIKSKKGFSILSISDIKDIISYKDLLYSLVKRDVGVIYKQTVLGFGWAILRPLVQMVIFTVFFGEMAGISSDIGGVPYAIFSYTALVPWAYFSTSLVGSTQSLVSNADFLTKVYFPRLIIPLTPIFAKMVDFLIAFSVLVMMMFYYGITPSYEVIYLPIMLALMVFTAFGMSLWFSALAVQYRDINQMIQFLGQLLMYLAPVIWPITYLDGWSETARTLYYLYPMAGVIEGFRAVLLNTTEVPWKMIGMGYISATFLVVTGLQFFRSKESTFADVA